MNESLEKLKRENENLRRENERYKKEEEIKQRIKKEAANKKQQELALLREKYKKM